MHWEGRFRQLAHSQDGVVGIDQLSSIDCDSRHWGRAKRNGRWTSLSRRVLRLDGTPASLGQRVHAALLDAGGGAVLHGRSTLAWVGVGTFDLATVHVGRRRGTRSDRAELAIVHRLRNLRDCDVCVMRGVPTVTPLRAIWSEASRYGNDRWHERGLRRIARLLDDAHGKNLLSWEALHDSVDDLQRSGRAGTRLMRELAAERLPGTSPTESRNEDRFETVLSGTDMPPMLRQRVVGGEEQIGRTDYRDAELPMVLEVNSIAFHSLPSDQRADEGRYAALVGAGFTVCVIWEPDVWSRPGNVVDTVREARRRARRGECVVVHSAGCPWPPDPDRITIPAVGPATRG